MQATFGDDRPETPSGLRVDKTGSYARPAEDAYGLHLSASSWVDDFDHSDPSRLNTLRQNPLPCSISTLPPLFTRVPRGRSQKSITTILHNPALDRGSGPLPFAHVMGCGATSVFR